MHTEQQPQPRATEIFSAGENVSSEPLLFYIAGFLGLHLRVFIITVMEVHVHVCT